MFYHLPPVGHPIKYFGCHADAEAFSRAVTPYGHQFYASGTAALAAAIIVACKRKAEIVEPEVILPAYACPDLISAAVYAGVRPVLVDLVPDRPWMDSEQLAAKLSARTVAVIAVNFLGIPERLGLIRPLLKSHDALLIEDSAQAFPRDNESGFWGGDLVVISFGRGKPVSLLGGGALLYRPELESWVRQPSPGTDSLVSKLKYLAKLLIYNNLIDPRRYWVPESMPGLKLGETVYHPLGELSAINRESLKLLSCNLQSYQHRSLTVKQAIGAGLAELPAIQDLPSLTAVPEERALLRYPVLVEPGKKEKIIDRLQKAGLGASRLYPSPLPRIPGVDKMPEISGEFPVAEDFSSRLMTLPTHAFVRPRDVQTMLGLLGTA